MRKDITSSLAYVLLASLFNVALAYLFGNNGYEAFITISIAVGFLLTWQSFNLVPLLFKSKVWLIIKLVGLLPLAFVWFVAVAGVILSVSTNAHDPSVSTPSINWLIVILGTLPFLVPRVAIYKATAGFQKTAIGLLVSLYSIIVLYIAALGFYDNNASNKNLILVIAVQLQYLMNYLITRTNYLHRSQVLAKNLAQHLSISHKDTGDYLMILIVGLPFILPLAIVLLISAI